MEMGAVKMESNKLTQEQKAAAVVVSLGTDKASKIYNRSGEAGTYQSGTDRGSTG